MPEALNFILGTAALVGGLALMAGGLILYRGNVADASPELYAGFVGFAVGLTMLTFPA